MSWNYRVVKRVVKSYPDGVPPNMQPLVDNGTIPMEDVEYSICEVHYSDAEQQIINGIGKAIKVDTFKSYYDVKPSEVDFAAVKALEPSPGLQWTLTKMLECLDKPIVDFDAFMREVKAKEGHKSIDWNEAKLHKL